MIDYLRGYVEGYNDGWRGGQRDALAHAGVDGLAASDAPAPPAGARIPLPDAWEHHPGEGVPADRLPPDLTSRPSWQPGGVEQCEHTWRGWVCTRRAGHTGRHAAGAAGTVVAVWRSASDSIVERAS